jgi:hypothetical protein
MLRENVLYSPEAIGSNDMRVYVISLVLRSKDFPEGYDFKIANPNMHEKFIRHWLVQTEEELFDQFPYMQAWADLFHGRLYLGVDAKNMSSVVISQIHEEIDMTAQSHATVSEACRDIKARYMKNFHSFPRKEGASISYLRRLLIDVDTIQEVPDFNARIDELCGRLAEAQTNPITRVPSKSGMHLVCLIRSPHTTTDTLLVDEILKEFHQKYPEIELESKRNSMVNLYMNVLQ